jgi:hypothetical protein
VVQLLYLPAEFPQTERFVPMLAALLPCGDDQTGRQVFEPDGCFRLVDVLTSGAARTEGVNFAFPQ